MEIGSKATYLVTNIEKHPQYHLDRFNVYMESEGNPPLRLDVYSERKPDISIGDEFEVVITRKTRQLEVAPQ